ncbi:DUF2637 domain-containing protein [Mycobacteroides abscessus]|uniref:DUF2637 domain-containing protein n=1 Tax=Mycobacteroides abscessus TaxID=36809 RepID=UPI001401C856|nr:DUF2637 domain-containing protein [Mycobacteroides abscessus]
MSTLTDRAEHDAERATAHKFFWRWLVGATVLTLLGNAAHALLAYIPTTVVRLAVYLIPPLIALVSIHGITVLARVGKMHRARTSASWRDAGSTYLLAVTVTALLALIAAILSYSGLYGVALAGGLSPRLAWLFPLCIDSGIAVSSVALVVLRPLSGADERVARLAQRTASTQVSKPSVPTPAPRQTPSAATATAPAAPRTATPSAPAAPRTAPSSAAQKVSGAAAPAPEVVALAEKIVASKAVRQPVGTVARILAMAESEGRKNVIADRAGVHHSVVSKVLSEAENQRRHGLVAVS